ncbi:MAG: hypothetical protein AAFV53_10320 [Myxococcota bacterium]
MLLLTVLGTANALPSSPPPAPPAAPTPAEWETLRQLAEESRQRGQPDAAIAWLEAWGVREAPLPEGAPVDALLSIGRDWAARGIRRIQDGDLEGGVADLAAVLRHGAAIERHSPDFSTRAAGAALQDEALTALENLNLSGMMSAEQATLLMALGEGDVVPAVVETLQRECDGIRRRLNAVDAQLRGISGWRYDHEASLKWIDDACAAAAQDASGPRWVADRVEGGWRNPIGAAVIEEMTRPLPVQLERRWVGAAGQRARRARLQEMVRGL